MDVSDQFIRKGLFNPALNLWNSLAVNSLTAEMSSGQNVHDFLPGILDVYKLNEGLWPGG